jgi:hypothetical protein
VVTTGTGRTAHTRRTLLVLALIIVASASLAAASPATTTTSFDTTGFHTRYPSTWSQLQQSSQPSIGTSVVWLANQPMHDPCTTTASGGGITSTCGFPIASLAPGGVVVHWSRDDGPNPVALDTLTIVDRDELSLVETLATDPAAGRQMLDAAVATRVPTAVRAAPSDLLEPTVYRHHHGGRVLHGD